MALAAGKSTETYKDQFNLMKNLKRYYRRDSKLLWEKYFYVQSSVLNRRAVRNKHAGGKIPKNTKHVGQNRRAGGKIFLKKK